MEKQGFHRGLRAVFIGVLIFALVSIITAFFINSYVKGRVRDKIILPQNSDSLRADCIIVLGAGVTPAGKPSKMLNDRLLQGIELYNRSCSDRIIMSGDHGRVEYDEVNVMKQFAVERGIPSDHVFMDHAGFSTYESLY